MLPPPISAAIVATAGAIALAMIMVAIGLMITSSPWSGSIGGWDAGLERWVVLHRTAALNTWTDIGSILAGTGTILLITAISIGILAIRRSWYDVGFLAIALSVEFAVFLAATTIVDRPRPAIQALDPMPITSSFPSGHVAAAIAVYAGLAIVISFHTHLLVVRIPVWILAVLAPVWVGVSRFYRGMHHPTDVMASVVLGLGELTCAFLAVRSAAVVADRRHRRREQAPPPAVPSRVRA